MKSNYLFLLAFTLGLFFSVNAQEGTITGIISDESLPLPGATVMIKGTTKGTTTDFDGNFVLRNVEVGTFNVEISYIGYEKKDIEVTLKENQAKNLGIITLVTASENLDEVTITGGTRRNSEARALSVQKKSMAILNVIAADGIGKLPDRNAAETVQRIQGVSIERDQGEGRFVSVRGLPPFWTSTTINGNRLPTAEEETTSRATAFDFFPSELIGYVQAAKAYTPDMEADGIGGGVNFITQTAPAKEQFSINVGSGYNAKSDKGVYDASITYGNRSEDGTFGYIINASHFNRNYATDNFEARRKGDEGVYRMEFRDYSGVRKTTGLNAALEFKPNPNEKYFLRSVYGTLVDEEKHYKHRVRFDKFDETDNTARVELQNIHNKLITELIGADLGAEYTLKNGKLDWTASTYRNSFKYGDIPNSTDNSYFVVKYKQDGVGINPDYLDVRSNGANDHRAYWKADGGLLDYDNPDTLFGFFSDPNFTTEANKLKFADLELYKVDVVERDNIVASVNYEHNFNDAFKIKVGGKFRDKDRRASFSDLFYEWDSSLPTPFLSDNPQFVKEQPGRAGYLEELNTNISNSFGAVLSTNGMATFWEQNQGNLALQDYSEAIQFMSGLGRNFDVDETHASVFGMGTYKISDKVTVLGGLRATNTKTTVKGFAVQNAKLRRVETTKEYLALLPMLHVKYSPQDNLNIRFAATRSFSRPNFGDITPGGTYIEADNEFKGGNPNLDPTYSLNFDLLGEYYFSNVGVVNAGVFYKNITDPIFNDTFQGTYNGISGVEISAPQNGGDAWIGGIELGINRRFDFLSGFWKNFGTQLNATFMDSEMTTPDDRKVSTPYQAKQLFNAQLYYETDKFNVRAAFNHKGKYAIAFGDKDINDVYYGKYSTLDMSASFKVNKNFTIYTDINNILNDPLIYHYGQSEERPKQVEFYGVKANIGLKFSI